MIWNDGVAPEQALDFDVPHISSQQAVAMWLGGFGFFFGLYQLVKTLDHPSNKPSVSIRPGPRAPAAARPAPSPPPLPCRSHPRNRAPSPPTRARTSASWSRRTFRAHWAAT